MEILRALTSRFSPGLVSERRGAIGIDFGSVALRLVQVRKHGAGDFCVCAHDRIPLQITAASSISELEDDIVPALRAAVRDNGFRGQRAVISMPAGSFRTFTLNYRPTAEQDDNQSIVQLMADRVDGPLSDYVLDCIPVRTAASEGDKLAIVALSRRTEVEALLRIIERSKLVPEVIEIAPVALRRLTAALHPEVNDLTLMLNTGRERSYLTLLSGRRLLLDQQLNFGERPLIDTLAQTLSLSPQQAQDLVLRTGLMNGTGRPLEGHHEGETGIFNTLLEILRPKLQELVEHTDQAFMYAAAQTRGGGAARIVLCGALTRWPGCDQVIASMTRLSVTTLGETGTSLWSTRRSDGDIDVGDYAVATGLGLRGLVDDA